MGKKKRPAKRVTISVPDELRRQMGKHPEVNWSAVAAQAFILKLGEIAKLKERKTMSDVVARMKASKLEEGSELFKQGQGAGEEWAKNHAEYGELKRLAGFKDDHDSQYDHDSLVGQAFGQYELIAFAILGLEDCHNRKASDDFWADALEGYEEMELLKEPEYLRGFVEGALAIWLALEGKI